MSSPQPAKIVMPDPDYARRVQEMRRNGQCFVCRVVDGTHGYSHHVVYQDDNTIAFLNRYPTLAGYCLVAPKRHLEDWVSDFSEAEFLAFQGVVRRVARAIATAVPTERMYSLCLGSQQANAHVHWHLAPLPPGIPFGQQQFGALMTENGILDISEADQAELAQAVRAQL